jgi:hypothetical protein
MDNAVNTRAAKAAKRCGRGTLSASGSLYFPTLTRFSFDAFIDFSLVFCQLFADIFLFELFFSSGVLSVCAYNALNLSAFRILYLEIERYFMLVKD